MSSNGAFFYDIKHPQERKIKHTTGNLPNLGLEARLRVFPRNGYNRLSLCQHLELNSLHFSRINLTNSRREIRRRKMRIETTLQNAQEFEVFLYFSHPQVPAH